MKTDNEMKRLSLNKYKKLLEVALIFLVQNKKKHDMINNLNLGHIDL